MGWWRSIFHLELFCTQILSLKIRDRDRRFVVICCFSKWSVYGKIQRRRCTL